LFTYSLPLYYSRDQLIEKFQNDNPQFKLDRIEIEVDKFMMDAEMANGYIKYLKDKKLNPRNYEAELEAELSLSNPRTVRILYYTIVRLTQKTRKKCTQKQCHEIFSQQRLIHMMCGSHTQSFLQIFTKILFCFVLRPIIQLATYGAWLFGGLSFGSFRTFVEEKFNSGEWTMPDLPFLPHS
jgi:hypothetical protein